MRRHDSARLVQENSADPLRKLRPIETLTGADPLHIVPIVLREGTAMSADEAMALKVRWAVRAGYRVLTRAVPPDLAPYNAVIRVHAGSTEDRLRDYLAVLAPAES